MSDVRYEVDGHVGIVTLDRPEVHNALRRRTYDELTELVRTTSARVLVVTGAGRSFCSGDDVRELMGSGDTPPRPEPRLTPAADALLHTDVPVIAAVNGPAVGWGMELALVADLRIAATSARFGELFVKRGLCSDVAGIARLAQLVGRERAAELLLTGEVIDAERAERIGLVGRVVPDDALLSTAVERAQAIAANPPLAVAALKRGLRRALDPDWHDLGTWVSTALGDLFATEDHREGVRSFLEKREPHYVGR
ncbi:enoyl-CoA hydratase/isomerase family protein [Saccharopolyspora rhizosphaerae]|uniref:Enoyl-CoA hydratase/isomerase family protein n=1 Tax=Saccharopolyspora rhizosphaerae TaxID=2492662 RepID=A0A426JNG7_9PSEU|nr:enoyl-CoA hydratase/isomerase family protein [Saccharopolyspora rhizosphaerae]RRO14714.1 enoyl-CoA hydratase/isomerase family protein [Saccharopolyspora rhizosphaerae]